MRGASIEMDKLVIWVLAALVALVILGFMISQLSPGNGLMSKVLSRITG